MKYRREIDGLRALAVIPVILFHAGFSQFSGGYVGVDVFFVISGYLITSILINDLSKKDFSIARFYEKRAKRILPALFFVMLLCVPFAWLWMVPEQFKEFSQAFVAISFFVSNILFWKKEDYFSPAAEENPLLHTWSLGVEEQFYLFFPLFLFCFWRLGQRRVFYVLLGLTFLSLLLSEWGWRNVPSANFYLLPFRAWELGVGSLCASLLYKREVQSSQFLSFTGLFLIIFSIFFFDKETPFPSLYALVPVIGSALIVLYCSKSTMIGQVLSTKVLVGIGLVSFSAYLWHQPLFAFARIRLLSEPSFGMMLILSFLSIVLAAFSWKFIEQPFRKGGRLLGSRNNIFILSGLTTALFVIFGLYGHFTGGVKERLVVPETITKDLHVRGFQDKCFDFSMEKIEGEGFFCEVGSNTEAPLVAIVGDSHSLSFLAPLAERFENRGESLLYSGISGCPPIINTYVLRNDSQRETCALRNQRVYTEIKERKIKTVYLIARWTTYSTGDVSGAYTYIGDEYEVEAKKEKSLKVFEENLKSTLAFLNELDIEVVLFHQPPVQEIDARSFYNWVSMFGEGEFSSYLKKKSVKSSEHYKRYLKAHDILENNAQLFQSVKTVNFNGFLCEHEDRCVIGTVNNSYYLDDDHLSNFGASVLIDTYSENIFNF